MRRILVTGSSGLIGSYLAREIERRHSDVDVHRVDLVDGNDCRTFFASDNGEWDLAIHCAAITGGIEGTTNNSAFQSATNSQLDGAYFQWALRCRPQRIVYFSSSCAYPMFVVGDEDYNLREDDIDFESYCFQPDMPYGWAKLNGEVMANAVRDAGVAVTTVRPFAIYGEAQENCRMIPAFIERATSDAETMEVWGPGNQASDFVHVSDCASAILAAIEHDVDGPLNIATGRGAPADEVAEIVMAQVGVKREIVHNLDKPYGPRWRVGDPTLMETIYKPQVSLEEGISRVVAARS